MAEQESKNEQTEKKLDERTRELVALGASVAANCLPCFKYHFRKLNGLEVTASEMEEAVNMARKVKANPPRHMEELADKLLSGLYDREQKKDSN